jgi:hypothetical protein
MANHERGAYYRALKEAGVDFSKPFRQLSLDELKQAYDRLDAEGLAPKLELPPEKTEEAQMWKDGPQPAAVTAEDFNELKEQIANLATFIAQTAAPKVIQPALDPTPMPAPQQPRVDPVPVMQKAPARDISRVATVHERPSNLPDEEPLYVDEGGVEWYRREVRKPAFPKPRGRRVLTYIETGVEQKTVTNGKYVETFEVASEHGPARTAEVKITLPSYQTGVYKDPRMPFKIHVYNEVRGFDLFDIWDYFGGESLVPKECKRMYVSNDLCYDIRSVINYIEAEHRRLQLQGRA